MPRKPVNPEKFAATLAELLDHIHTAEEQLAYAAKLFAKLGRSWPRAPERMDRVCDTTNKLAALRMNILLDVQRTEWCDEALAERLSSIQKRFEDLSAGRLRNDQ